MKLSPPLAKVLADIADGEIEDSHPQFITVTLRNGRKAAIFTTASAATGARGFDHALLYRGSDCIGSCDSLAALRRSAE